jgi:NAD(P) transhydrogenase
MLKLIVHADTREILGVHVFGTSATELVHIGQAIMGCGGTVDYLVDTVLNYPTLSEAYKVAALDVTNKLRAVAPVQHRNDDVRAEHAVILCSAHTGAVYCCRPRFREPKCVAR